MLLVCLAAPFTQVQAESDPMEGMDHSKMSHGSMASGPQDAAAPTPSPIAPETPVHQHDHATHNPAAHNPASQAPETAREANYSDGYGFDPAIVHSHKEEHNLAALLVDRLEGLGTDTQSLLTYDWQAWYGKTYDRAVFRAEGNIDAGQFTEARNELLWGHALTAYWDTQLGVRYDTGQGDDRGWFAFGFQGLAPYWLYIEATAYIGEQGRIAFRFESEYDILITQRLILQPRIEANIYSQRDLSRGVSDGLSDFESGLRLRYEIRREFAPYIGLEWSTSHDVNSTTDSSSDALRWVAGLRFWF
ncbi:copper resistance protein B [Methylovulum sp.]|uniref:copper resistance protein B n=1 Tax=Methylovulum sp. TaxID=1916980 RepID=UPI00260DF2B4|nr:copper resistance protein B [Methylovulum sp.]MDD5126340.1 copper resistance protein B [Methylovulum sp.]